ncbi:MAG: VTT domain-containing protein [Candidatus Binatia bacterium]
MRRILTIAITVAALLLIGRTAGGYLPRFAAWVEAQGALGPVVFIAGYAAATVVGAPGSVLTLAAGAIFGIAAGTLFAFIGATLGATGAFLLARYVARSAVEKRVAADARFAAIDRAVGEQGRRLVFLLRLSPVFPFNLLNYALGLTRVRLGDYVAASVGMLPATLLYVYYGKVIGEVAATAGGAAPERDAAYYLLIAVGLAATLAVTVAVTRIARRALHEATGA